MFQLGKTIVSEDIIEKDFVCNLSACKGACCVDGEAGGRGVQIANKRVRAARRQVAAADRLLAQGVIVDVVRAERIGRIAETINVRVSAGLALSFPSRVGVVVAACSRASRHISMSWRPSHASDSRMTIVARS